MHRVTSSLVAAGVIGQLVGLLGWIDPLFLPLALLAPVVTGALTAGAHLSYRWIAVLWCSAGLNMLWTDWLITGGDQLFHVGLSVVMPLLAGFGFWVVTLAARPRRRTA